MKDRSRLLVQSCDQTCDPYCHSLLAPKNLIVVHAMILAIFALRMLSDRVSWMGDAQGSRRGMFVGIGSFDDFLCDVGRCEEGEGVVGNQGNEGALIAPKPP
jgi:hypothetical protein